MKIMIPKPEYVTGIRCLKIGCPGKLRCSESPILHGYMDDFLLSEDQARKLGMEDYVPWRKDDGFTLAVHCPSCRMEMTVRLSENYRLIKHEDDVSITWEIVSVLEAVARDAAGCVTSLVPSPDPPRTATD